MEKRGTDRGSFSPVIGNIPTKDRGLW